MRARNAVRDEVERHHDAAQRAMLGEHVLDHGQPASRLENAADLGEPPNRVGYRAEDARGHRHIETLIGIVANRGAAASQTRWSRPERSIWDSTQGLL